MKCWTLSLSSYHIFQLNFAKYRRNLKGYKKTTTNTQVIGFTDTDTHHDVLTKGARGLEIKCNVDELSLICSGGLVPNIPIGDQPWKLGKYIKLNGGTVTRSKKLWGIYIPTDVDDQLEDSRSTLNSVRYNFVYNMYLISNCSCDNNFTCDRV